MEKRNNNIDIIKGIGIFSVVVGHALNTDVFPSYLCDVIRNFVYAFHLPVFFFCSGYLFKEQRSFYSVLYSIKRKYKKFVVICIVSFLFLPLFIHLGCIEHKASFLYVIGKCMKIFLFRPSGIFVSAMWFVPCLCLAQLMYFFFLKVAGTLKKMIYFIFIFIVVGIYMTKNEFLYYYNFNVSILMVPVMFLGKIGRDMDIIKKIENKKYTMILCIMSLFAILAINSITQKSIDLSKGIIYGGWLFYFIILLGILFCISFACILPPLHAGYKCCISFRKGFIIMGENSLYIMAFHFIVFKLIDGLAYKLFSIGMLPECRYWPISHPEFRFFYCFLGIALPIIMINLIRKIR